METSGTDMLNDSDNRATISPLHLAVSTAFTASLMAALLKISHTCLCWLKLGPRTLGPNNDDRRIKAVRTCLIQRIL